MAVRHALARSVVALSLLLGVGCGGGATTKNDAGDASATPDVVDGRDTGPGDLPAPPEAGGEVQADGAGDGRTLTDASPGGDAVDAPGDRPDVKYPGLCGMTRGTFQPGSAPVTGVLSGPGANPVVSCGGGLATAGADAAYALEVDTAGIVELVLESTFDAVLALRKGCDEGVSEVACSQHALLSIGDDSDGGAADAEVPAGPGADGKWRTTLRARLTPGTYIVLADTAGIRQEANPFTISARALEPLSNASCATPILLSGTGSVTGQELSLGGDPAGACGGRSEATLYYTVGVPSGQRLTVRATPRAGDRTWLPRIEASATCTGTCLAQGHSASGSMQVLDWSNNGPNWRLVVLAVSADASVSGARFDLAVSVVDQLATCTRPAPVVNGAMVVGQDAQRAPISDTPSCTGARARTLYYAATLLPQQELTASAIPNSSSNPPALFVRTSCEITECEGGGGSVLSYTNKTSETQTVLIEAQPAFPSAPSVFDLLISTPPPPAGVTVTAPFGLTTTETGGTAKATLVLRSPPTAPVTIALASDTPTEGTVSPASLVFDATNWNVPQEVTVKGVDDQIADGPRRYTIVTSAAMSSDTRYKDLAADDFEVTNQDDDPGLSIEGAQHLATTEGGGAATFKVRLNRQPTGTVRVPLSSSDISEAAVSPAELVFSDANWNVAQDVTVTGVDDAMRDGTQPYTIVVGALVSSDPAYAGQNPPDVAGLNRDDDQVAVGTKILSGDHSCVAPYGRPITTDLAGNIYVVMSCENDLVVTTSTDAGATFSEPKVIAPGANVGEIAIAGGPAGVAYLAYVSGNDGLVFRRTSDGGVTWTAGQTLLPTSYNLRVGAAGDSLLLTSSSDGGNGNAFLWRSPNGGRSVLTRSWLDRSNVELFVRPDGRTVFLVEVGPDKTQVVKSTNGGDTFAAVGELNSINSGGTWAMTSTSLVYAGGGVFNAYSLANLSDSIGYENFVSNVLALAVDERDIVTTIDVEPQTNRLRASRFDVTSATVPDTHPKLIGPYADGAAAVALSPRAVAAISWTGSLVLFAITTWP